MKLYNLVDLLVQRDGINLNILDKQFSSPLWIALQSQMEDIANILFEKGKAFFFGKKKTKINNNVKPSKFNKVVI